MPKRHRTPLTLTTIDAETEAHTVMARDISRIIGLTKHCIFGNIVHDTEIWPAVERCIRPVGWLTQLRKQTPLK